MTALQAAGATFQGPDSDQPFRNVGVTLAIHFPRKASLAKPPMESERLRALLAARQRWTAVL